MHHDITTLRYVVVTAEARSFSKAAAEMQVKQATLSRRIASLEAQIGVKLFDRSTRGAFPTKAAARFIHIAREVLNDLDHLVIESKSFGPAAASNLSIGFSTPLSAGNLRATIADFIAHHPDREMLFVENDRVRLLQYLHAQVVDFIIISGKVEDRNLQRKSLWSECVVVAMPDDHHLVEKDRIYWSDLRGEQFVLSYQDPGTDLAELARARLWEIGREPEVSVQEISRDNAINLVGLKQFITLTTESAIGNNFPGVTFRAIRESSGNVFHIDYSGYWKLDSNNEEVYKFIDLIERRHPELYDKKFR